MQENTMTGVGAMDGAIGRKVEVANSSAHHAIDRASSAAGPVVDQLAAGAHQAVDRVTLAANQAAGSIESASARIRAAQTQWVESCGSYVREKPLAALGIATAGGFMLGLLLGMRR